MSKALYCTPTAPEFTELRLDPSSRPPSATPTVGLVARSDVRQALIGMPDQICGSKQPRRCNLRCITAALKTIPVLDAAVLIALLVALVDHGVVYWVIGP